MKNNKFPTAIWIK